MHFKNICGVIVLLLGLSLIGGSLYISNVVAKKVTDAEQKARNITDNPITRLGGEVTRIIGSPIRKFVSKKAACKAGPYHKLSDQLLIAGICLTGLGLLTLLIHGKQKKP